MFKPISADWHAHMKRIANIKSKNRVNAALKNLEKANEARKAKFDKNANVIANQ